MTVARLAVAAAAALSAVAAAPGEERQMLEAFENALEAMTGVAGALCVFALVWAGFTAMADGADARGSRARNAVVLAIVGLALVLSARGLAALISAGAAPVPPA